MLVSAGRERKSAGKAIDGGGIGIVTIVSSISLVHNYFIWHSGGREKTACSGSPASPLASGAPRRGVGRTAPFLSRLICVFLFNDLRPQDSECA